MDSANLSSPTSISRSSTPIPLSNRSKSLRDFVTRVLSPKVAIISSPDVDQEEVLTARDSQGLPNPIENFAIRFSSLTSLEQPDVQLTSQILSDRVKSISNNSSSIEDFPQITAKTDVTERYLEGIIAISSSNNEPIATLSQMNDITSPTPIFDKGFIDTNILRYYVLIHDNHKVSLEHFSLPLSPTTSTLNSPSSSFTEDVLFSKESGNDSQVSLGLGLSSNEIPTLIYGQYLSDDDLAGIHVFVRELVVQSVVPFMERNIQHWNEQVASSRRGITGRIFSAGRRYFNAGPKTSGSIQQSSYTSNVSSNAIYPHNSPEAQMRKLADWSFMLRDYKFAHSVYETIKKDFSADKAWKYYAGAQ
ncbi:10076_t:CDS:2, partial [Acaulospora colombiana]